MAFVNIYVEFNDLVYQMWSIFCHYRAHVMDSRLFDFVKVDDKKKKMDSRLDFTSINSIGQYFCVSKHIHRWN